MRLIQIFCLSILVLFFGCKEDAINNVDDPNFKVNIRIAKDPGKVNPFFSPSAAGRKIFQYIFIPIADFHPETLELTPNLIKEIPIGYASTLDDGTPTIAYDLEFVDANWSDGHKLNARDYVFTVNAIKHPSCKAAAWKPYFDNILDTSLDKDNEMKVTVHCNPNYMLSLETVLTSYLLAEHQFDNDEVLADSDLLSESDTIQQNILTAVNASMDLKEDIIQLGPYKISDLQTDNYYILDKINNHWTTNFPERPYLASHPSSIVLKIVPDEVSAVTMLKEGSLDFMELKSADTFLGLRDDDEFAKNWNFHTPQLMFFYYIAVNNASGLTSDKKIRKALAHLIDVDDIIYNVDKGLGVRTTGYFHPTKSYYNDQLSEIKLDIEKAITYLKSAGWTELNADGIRTKEVNGKPTPLDVEILITGSELSKKIALLFQESAKKAGVNIVITTKKTAVMRKENISVFKYDLAALAAGQDAAPDDPYSIFHSDNAVPGTKNISGYSNPAADDLIQKIRTTRNPEERKSYYLELQEILYDDQALIFLYSPLMKMVCSKKFVMTSSSKRPGYFANTFKLTS